MRNSRLLVLTLVATFSTGTAAYAAWPDDPVTSYAVAPLSGNRVISVAREVDGFGPFDPFASLAVVDSPTFTPQMLSEVAEAGLSNYARYFRGGAVPQNALINAGHSVFGPEGRIFSGTWNDNADTPWPMPQRNDRLAGRMSRRLLGIMTTHGLTEMVFLGCYGPRIAASLNASLVSEAQRIGIIPSTIRLWLASIDGTVLPSSRTDLAVFPLYGNHGLLASGSRGHIVETVSPYGGPGLTYGNQRRGAMFPRYYGGPSTHALEFIPRNLSADDAPVVGQRRMSSLPAGRRYPLVVRPTGR